MGIQDFLLAVATASQKYASTYGLDSKELQLALIANAGLEGGLGDTPGVGDGGASHGRFQFNVNGGHGATLLNGGWTLEDFYNDQKVVDHWAPILAQSLQTMKSKGYSGGEAIRQAAFAVERPAEMYPAERFNASLAQASGLMGGAPRVSQAGGNAVDGDLVSKSREALRKRVSDAIAKYDQTGAEPDYMELQKALFDLGTFEDAQPAGGGDNDPAQKAFDNSIKLGDFNSKEADRLYSRWSDKSQMARDATEGQISSAQKSNQVNEGLASTIFERNGTGPKPLARTLMEPRYEDALAKWNSRFGVGNEPSASFNSGIGLPGAGQQSAEVMPPTGGAITDPNAFRPDWGTMTRPEEREPGYGLAGKIPFGKVATDVYRGYTGQEPIGNALDSKAFFNSGRAARALSDVTGAGAGAAVNAGAGAAKKGKKWWQTLTNPATYKMGVPGYKTGTASHPGGPAMVNENGPETVIIPQFGPQQMPGGAHVANLPAGSAVIPSGVPLDEAHMFSQIRQGLEAPDASEDPRGQYERANDPDLQAKVMEAMKRAMASNMAATPPKTPVLRGQWAKDPWQDLRGLSGVPASEQEYAMQQEAAAKGGR